MFYLLCIVLSSIIFVKLLDLSASMVISAVLSNFLPYQSSDEFGTANVFLNFERVGFIKRAFPSILFLLSKCVVVSF